MEGISNEDNFNQNDTCFLSRNSNFSNLGDSNFFSTYGEKSMVMKQLNEMDKQNEEDNKSNFTIELDLERQVDSLIYDEDDDLNDAKYLEIDQSNCSSTSNLLNSNNFYNNQNQHNVSMPLLNNILTNQIYPTNENEEKIINNNILNKVNSTTEINKKILLDKNKDKNNEKEKELNISILGDKCTDTFTGDSNNNMTNLIPNLKGGGTLLGSKNLVGEKENIINMTESNTSSFDFLSNSVDFNNINLIRGLYYTQTPNNSIYYNSNYMKNNKRYNKFQQNYSQSQYLRDYYSNRKPSNKNFINSTKTFNNMNNNINYSELSSRASVQSLNINNHTKYDNYNNKFNTINNNYRNNIHIKMRDESNKSYTENLKLIMLKDQKGSKLLQKKIDEKSPEFLYKLYDQIKNNLFDIMTDQYGNYVIQKLVDNCDKKLISTMLQKLSQNVNSKTLYEISINNYGTRPLQKMFENLSSSMTQQDINIILNFTKGNVQNLIKDINGNRVIQSIILNVKNKEVLTPIYKEMAENINEIIKTKSGCCVFAKVLTNIIENDLNNIVDIIINNFNQLINDEFGNISLKRIIKLNHENYNEKIYNCIKDNIIQLSCQKFSSNVIEACIDNTTSLKKKTIEKLIDNENNIHDLILDQFGNYIVQNALQNAEQKEFDIIIQQIKENEKKLKQTQNGKIVFEKLMKNYKQYLVDNKGNKNENKININNNENTTNRNKKQKYHGGGMKNKNKFNNGKKNKK